MRIEVEEFMRASENLARQDAVLTVQECEVVSRCVRELEKKILPDRQQSDRPTPYPTSHR